MKIKILILLMLAAPLYSQKETYLRLENNTKKKFSYIIKIGKNNTYIGNIKKKAKRILLSNMYNQQSISIEITHQKITQSGCLPIKTQAHSLTAIMNVSERLGLIEKPKDLLNFDSDKNNNFLNSNNNKSIQDNKKTPIEISIQDTQHELGEAIPAKFKITATYNGSSCVEYPSKQVCVNQ